MGDASGFPPRQYITHDGIAPMNGGRRIFLHRHYAEFFRTGIRECSCGGYQTILETAIDITFICDSCRYTEKITDPDVYQLYQAMSILKSMDGMLRSRRR